MVGGGVMVLIVVVVVVSPASLCRRPPARPMLCATMERDCREAVASRQSLPPKPGDGEEKTEART